MKKSVIFSFVAAMLMLSCAAFADNYGPDFFNYEHALAPQEHYSFLLDKLLPNKKYHATCNINFNASPQIAAPSLTMQLGELIQGETGLFAFSSQGGTTKTGTITQPFHFTLDNPNYSADVTIPFLTSVNKSIDFVNESKSTQATVDCWIYPLI